MKTALLIILFVTPIFSIAADINDLKSKLEERARQIGELQKEIEGYQGEVSKTEKEAKTIVSEVQKLDAAIAKLQTDIKITQRRIEFSELTIEKAALDIRKTEDSIQTNQALLADLLRQIDGLTSESLIEIMLANASISGFFNKVEQINSIHAAARHQLGDLRKNKNELESELILREGEKSRHLELKNELTDRRAIEAEARSEKAGLLKITKKKESEYRKSLDDRIRKREALESEIRAIEGEIRVTIDQTLLPNPGSGILGFPLSEISLKSCSGGGDFGNCVTQFFGTTSFATQNPQVYSGNGHNGVDFRAAIGTEVLSSYGGKVRASGNTDDQCRGVSYGRWVLIDHPNNLSTLYAHLSRSSVSAGAEVKRGERIGYTGQTGYATGPHLHFAVFAAEAVQVTSLDPKDKYYYKSRICGTPLYMPVSPQNGYLNPLSYL